MLVDYNDIRKGPVARLEQPVLKPELANEREGQVNQVVFCEGLVQFKGQWFCISVKVTLSWGLLLPQ